MRRAICKLATGVALLVIASAAFGQNASEPLNPMVVKTLRALQAQRNSLADDVINAQARAGLLEEEAAALRKRIADLEAQIKTQSKAEDNQP